MGACDSGNLEQRCDQAMEMKNQGRYEEAVAVFKEVLEREPTHGRAHLGLGLVYCFMGFFDASLEELKHAVECSPDWIDAHLNLAKTYAMLGMYDEAKTGFNRVLEINPNHAEAKKQLKYFENSG